MGRKGEKMYTGTLIDELMKAVERTERRAIQEHSPEDKLAHFYAVSQSELVQFEGELSGVA